MCLAALKGFKTLSGLEKAKEVFPSCPVLQVGAKMRQVFPLIPILRPFKISDSMTRNRFFAAVLLITSGLNLSAQEENITLARYPALSQDGEQLAFSFQGDIWVMDLETENAIPRRITIHEAYESHPVFSPDGKSLAFTSNRFGHKDVFSVPVNGGRPNRLTYHEANDQATDWTAGKILFETDRVFQQVEWDGEIYQVPQEGGTPTRALNAVGEMASLSPNGRYLAFVRGACRISRESYTGPADKEIWVYDRQREEFFQVTDNEVNDFLPRWNDDDELYYLSSINGRYNLVKVEVDGYDPSVEPEALTSFTEEGIRWFDVADERVVMERGTGLYLMEEDEKPRELPITIATDYRFDPVTTREFKSGIDEFQVSPNGKFAAMVIHGEVFVKQLDKEKSRSVNLSDHPYRDRSVAWLNDSALIFVSDREGQYDLYLARSSDRKKTGLFQSLKHEVVRLTQTAEDESDPVVSPDGKKIAFGRGRGKLVVADIDPNGNLSNSKSLLDGWATPGGVSWSPDSRYLSYSKSDLNFNSEVYIQPAAGGEPVNVSMHPRGDYSPYWSKDGSKLGFLSSRNDGDADVWFVWLKKEDWLKTKEDREEGLYFEPDTTQKNDTTKTKADSLATGLARVQIDFENIHDRLEQVTSMPGDERQVLISHDGKSFYFTARSNVARGYDLYKINYDGSDIAQLTDGGTNPQDVRLSPDGKKLFFTKDGVIHDIAIDSKKTTRYPHEAMMTINRDAEREQIFEEAWSALKEGFYDPNFHGQDWTALKAKYKPRAMAASTTQDFRDMFNLMLGELNASHMGLYGSDPEETQKENVGLLGIEVLPVEEGVRVLKVVPNSPADRPQSRLKPGETIIAVGGKPIREGENFYRLLAHQTGKQVLMTVKSDRGQEREIVIRPTNSLRTELYEDWVNERQKLVEKYSNGRLGYIHIQGMNKPSFERFERELMASGQGKDGIVIDVRFNGGGWTTDYLMAVLTVRQHAYTIPRGAATSLEEHKKFSDYYPYSERLPLSAWVKPSIAMCNESSYSNAEIFSHAYKNLDIGTLVGMPTFGAVISTGGMSLLDGSFVRMPFRGWYVKATDENMENGPAVPDVLVDNQPGDKAAGEDPQLKKAVETLLGQIDQKN